MLGPLFLVSDLSSRVIGLPVTLYGTRGQERGLP